MPNGSGGPDPRRIENAAQWAEALGEMEELCQGRAGSAEVARMQALMRAIRAYEETLIVEMRQTE